MPEIPSVSNIAPSSTSPMSADDIVDLFGQDDDKVVEEKTERKIVKSDKEEDEDDKKDKSNLIEDDEIELKDPDKDDDDINKLNLKDDEIEINAPPRKKEILAKFPEIFKTFPFLEKMLYRDREYTELFGSFDDAKEIAEKAESFASFENELLSGNTENILRNIKETDSKAFDKIVDGYMLALHKVDKDAYFEVAGNISKRLIMDMVKEANESQNDELKQAALIINQFLFGSSKFVPPASRVENKSDEKSEAEQERLSFVQERFETSRDDLQIKVDNVLKATISEYIDPKGMMTGYVKKNAISDALKELHSSLGSDTGLRKNLDKLWKAAFDSKFSKESLGRIQSFYLGRAKVNLPSAIKKARAEALKDLIARPKSDEDKEEKEETSNRQEPRRNLNAGRPSVQKTTKDIQKGESVTEFFMRD